VKVQYSLRFSVEEVEAILREHAENQGESIPTEGVVLRLSTRKGATFGPPRAKRTAEPETAETVSRVVEG